MPLTHTPAETRVIPPPLSYQSSPGRNNPIMVQLGNIKWGQTEINFDRERGRERKMMRCLFIDYGRQEKAYNRFRSY